VKIKQVANLSHLLLASQLEAVGVGVVVGLYDDEVARLRMNDEPTRCVLQRSGNLVEHRSELLQSQDPATSLSCTNS